MASSDITSLALKQSCIPAASSWVNNRLQTQGLSLFPSAWCKIKSVDFCCICSKRSPNFLQAVWCFVLLAKALQQSCVMNLVFKTKTLQSAGVQTFQFNPCSFDLSGRCWIFSCLNAMRLPFMKKYNIEEFEFSQSYLFFWDKVWEHRLQVMLGQLVQLGVSTGTGFLLGSTILTLQVEIMRSVKSYLNQYFKH